MIIYLFDIAGLVCIAAALYFHFRRKSVKVQAVKARPGYCPVCHKKMARVKLALEENRDIWFCKNHTGGMRFNYITLVEIRKSEK